jgi:hypothetical protein
VIQEGVQEVLQVLGRLLVRKGQHLLEDLGDGAVVVRPRRVDPEVEPLQERAFAGGGLDQPVDEPAPRAKVGVGTGQVLCGTRLRTSSGCRSASSWPMMLPPENPATWAEGTSSARRTPAASSAMASTVTGPLGMAVRPAPRLSKAVRRSRSASPSSWNCHDSTVSPKPR